MSKNKKQAWVGRGLLASDPEARPFFGAERHDSLIAQTQEIRQRIRRLHGVGCPGAWEAWDEPTTPTRGPVPVEGCRTCHTIVEL